MLESCRLPGPINTDGLRLCLIDRTPDKQLHMVAVRHLRDYGFFSCCIAVGGLFLDYGTGAVDTFNCHGVGSPVALIGQLVDNIRQRVSAEVEQAIETIYALHYRCHGWTPHLEEVPVGFGMVSPASPQCDAHGCEGDEGAGYGDPILERNMTHIQIFPHKKNAAVAPAAVTKE